eukprot:2598500-Pyramimonas_sp.AAC.1
MATWRWRRVYGDMAMAMSMTMAKFHAHLLARAGAHPFPPQQRALPFLHVVVTALGMLVWEWSGNAQWSNFDLD